MATTAAGCVAGLPQLASAPPLASACACVRLHVVLDRVLRVEQDGVDHGPADAQERHHARGPAAQEKFAASIRGTVHDKLVGWARHRTDPPSSCVWPDAEGP